MTARLEWLTNRVCGQAALAYQRASERASEAVGHKDMNLGEQYVARLTAGAEAMRRVLEAAAQEAETPREHHDIEPGNKVVRVYSDGSYLLETRSGQRKRYSFGAPAAVQGENTP